MHSLTVVSAPSHSGRGQTAGAAVGRLGVAKQAANNRQPQPSTDTDARYVRPEKSEPVCAAVRPSSFACGVLLKETVVPPFVFLTELAILHVPELSQ
jgi:hypothetical protein